MSTLTLDNLNQYQDQGFLSPVNALTTDEAKEVREEIERIEKKWRKKLNAPLAYLILLHVQ